MKNTMNVTVILEGGLVRDVLDVPDYDVLDLDTLEGSDLEEARELLDQAEATLPEDYPGRDMILKKISDTLAYLEGLDD